MHYKYIVSNTCSIFYLSIYICGHLHIVLLGAVCFVQDYVKSVCKSLGLHFNQYIVEVYFKANLFSRLCMNSLMHSLEKFTEGPLVNGIYSTPS